MGLEASGRAPDCEEPHFISRAVEQGDLLEGDRTPGGLGLYEMRVPLRAPSTMNEIGASCSAAPSWDRVSTGITRSCRLLSEMDSASEPPSDSTVL